MRKILLAMGAAAIIAAPAVSQAAEETRAVLSPSCDPAKLREIAGDAVVNIEPGAQPNIYNITLETSKMDFNQLAQQMAQNGCFNQ